MHKFPAWFAIHDICLLVISKVVVDTQPMVLKLSGSLRLVISAMVPLSRWTSLGQDLGSCSRLFLQGRRWSGFYTVYSSSTCSFISVTGFWDQSKLLEIAIELTLLHLDSSVVAV